MQCAITKYPLVEWGLFAYLMPLLLFMVAVAAGCCTITYLIWNKRSVNFSLLSDRRSCYHFVARGRWHVAAGNKGKKCNKETRENHVRRHLDACNFSFQSRRSLGGATPRDTPSTAFIVLNTLLARYFRFRLIIAKESEENKNDIVGCACGKKNTISN